MESPGPVGCLAAKLVSAAGGLIGFRGLGFRVRDLMGKKMETTTVYWDKGKMETTIVYWGYVGIMENKVETTI